MFVGLNDRLSVYLFKNCLPVRSFISRYLRLFDCLSIYLLEA